MLKPRLSLQEVHPELCDHSSYVPCILLLLLRVCVCKPYSNSPRLPATNICKVHDGFCILCFTRLPKVRVQILSKHLLLIWRKISGMQLDRKEAYNGKQIPGTNMTFELSWAPFRMYIDRRPDEEEMEDPNGKKNKDICLAPTVSKLALGPPPPTDNDCSTDIIFIGTVDPNFKEDEVLQIFSKFGPLVCVQINTSRGCGLVQFKGKEAAQSAMQEVRKLVHINKIGFIGWGRSEEMQGNVFFNPILNQFSDAFHSSTWGGQRFPCQSSALGAQGNFGLHLSGRLGPPPGLKPWPVRYAFGYDSSGISRVAVIQGRVSRYLLYPTTGAPMASRVDAPCSAVPLENR